MPLRLGERVGHDLRLINCTNSLIKIRNLSLREGKKLVQASWQAALQPFCLGIERDTAYQQGDTACLACHVSQTTLLSPPVRRKCQSVAVLGSGVWNHRHQVDSPVVIKVLNL